MITYCIKESGSVILVRLVQPENIYLLWLKSQVVLYVLDQCNQKHTHLLCYRVIVILSRLWQYKIHHHLLVRVGRYLLDQASKNAYLPIVRVRVLYLADYATRKCTRPIELQSQGGVMLVRLSQPSNALSPIVILQSQVLLYLLD